MAKVDIHTMSIMELSYLVFVAMVAALQKAAKPFTSSVSLIASINQISAFKALMILELFPIMLTKCRHYTPEPRFQTANRETRTRAI